MITKAIVKFPRQLVLVLVLLAGFGCSTGQQTTIESGAGIQSTAESIDELLRLAQSRSGFEASALSIQAMELMLDDGQATRAGLIAAQIPEPGSLPGSYQFRYALVRAEIALHGQQSEAALRWLTGDLIDNLENPAQRVDDYYFLLAGAYHANEKFAEAINAYLQISTSGDQAGDGGLVNSIWDTLIRLDEESVSAYASSANSYESRGWIELAEVVRSNQSSIKRQLDAIKQWQRVWIRHSASTRLPQELHDLQRVWDERPRHIALILPLQEIAGQAIQEGFFSAYYQALAISREVPRISIYDSSNVRIIFPIYDEAVASGADLIIGPLSKELVNQLQQLPELPVPTLALNYADDTQLRKSVLYQFGLAPEDEIAQAIDLAWDAGHRNAAVITPQSESYMRLQSIFSELWSARGGNLVSQAAFSGDGDYVDVIKRLMAIDSSEARRDRLLDLLPRNTLEFTPRRRSDLDFIFLIANPRQGRQLKPTLAFYFAEKLPVYSLPSIYDGQENESENRDLDGIIFTVAPWVLDSNPLKSEMSANLRQAQGALQRFRVMGIDCFRLYPRLGQLADHQIESFQGATGVLRLSPNRQIHRTLDVARFVNGIATEIESYANNRN
ncbi:MAG: penicillin-binding protein activator [Proteobacteria bacterium]|nr:penicillin-binding protein activator [Pseudomonadota bacterium]